MTNGSELGIFLKARRAAVQPEDVGLPTGTSVRRTPGLRREEVAILAGVSVDYYTRLERGNLRGASDSVLEALARALQLTEAERAHLFDLAAAATSGPVTCPPPRYPARQPVRPSVQRVLDAMTGAPAMLHNGWFDTLAGNRLGRALFAHSATDSARPGNTARFLFLDPRARDFYVEWSRIADDIVASLRAEAGRNPCNKSLTDLVGELSTRSEDFRVRWAAHDVHLHRTGVKKFHHPVVGPLTLTFEAMALAADPGLTLVAYSAEPGSPSQDALDLLASWAATVDQEAREAAADVDAGGSADSAASTARRLA
jgi:transcriptional regulator with XRE-family HTH domain